MIVYQFNLKLKAQLTLEQEDELECALVAQCEDLPGLIEGSLSWQSGKDRETDDTEEKSERLNDSEGESDR